MTTSINTINENDSPVIRALASYFVKKREEKERRELLDKEENAPAGQNQQEVINDSI